MATELRIDVRDLEPPEPLEVALDMADKLQSGEYLRMLHRREPFPLYRLLEQTGFRHHLHSGGDCPFEILIWRAGDSEAEQTVQRIVNPHA
jgi:uncharacterized protein (DUF2249 family)